MRFSDFKKLKTVKHLINLSELTINRDTEDLRRIIVMDKRSKLITGIWNIKPVGISQTQVYIVCPYCGEVHCHGKSADGYKGFRKPHCNNSNNSNPEYKLI